MQWLKKIFLNYWLTFARWIMLDGVGHELSPKDCDIVTGSDVFLK